MKKTCSKCREELPLEDFREDSRYKDGHTTWCKPCHRANNRKNGPARKRLLREQALARYGGACACCGERRYEFLAFDHINGGGNAHRQQVAQGNGCDLVPWLIRNNYPAGFRVLCHNCNCARGFYGFCPHEEDY